MGLPIVTEVHCSSRQGTIKIPPCSKAINADQRLSPVLVMSHMNTDQRPTPVVVTSHMNADQRPSPVVVTSYMNADQRPSPVVVMSHMNAKFSSIVYQTTEQVYMYVLFQTLKN